MLSSSRLYTSIGDWPMNQISRLPATAATASATARLPQKSRLSSGASIAPGMTSMMALSTISITVMDAVSAASASFSAGPTAIACRRGRNVKA